MSQEKTYFHVPSVLLVELNVLLEELEHCEGAREHMRNRASVALLALSGINAYPPSDSSTCKGK